MRKNQKGFASVIFILIIVALIGVVGWFVFQGSQPKQEVVQPQLTPETTQGPGVTSQTETGGEITNKFSYKSFSLNYPSSWSLTTMDMANNFPLRERLFPLYSSDKVVALSRNNTYLILIIEEGDEGESGGIFLNDGHYNEFVSDKDEFIIGDSVFHLSKNHRDIALLQESHDGPYVWSALTEFIPKKMTQSGDVFRGYEGIIKRNGYIYNFIITSNEGGDTDLQLQKEIVSILQSIEW